jgi:hypothetical protein
MKLLSEFIDAERERFRIRDNNLFAFSFGHIERYYSFLCAIEARQREASSNFIRNSEALRAAVPSGTRALTDEQRRLLDEGRVLTNLLHLEIESFYLFAKILLDKIAHAIEFFFGPVRGRSLDSHDDLVKDFEKYAKNKGLVIPNGFSELAASLKKDISDFRDYEIAHEKSPRRMNATGFSADGRTTMISTVIYPTAKDQQVSSKVVGDLLREIETYIKLLVVLMRKNRKATRHQAPEAEGAGIEK